MYFLANNYNIAICIFTNFKACCDYVTYHMLHYIAHTRYEMKHSLDVLSLPSYVVKTVTYIIIAQFNTHVHSTAIITNTVYSV